MNEVKNKYIIELEEEYGKGDNRLFRAKNFRSLVFDLEGLKKLTPFNESAYKTGYEDAYRTGNYAEAYQKGLDDAWEAIKKIMLSSDRGGLPESDLVRMGLTSGGNLYKRDIKEIVKLIREYETEQAEKESEIEVGDEIIVNGETAVVLHLYEKTSFVGAMRANGEVINVNTYGLAKTGKHYHEPTWVMNQLYMADCERKKKEGENG